MFRFGFTELPETVVFNSTALPRKCFDVFQRMKETGECCDVRINLEDYSILAHRVILHAVFPGLKDLLEDKNTTGNEKEITIENINANTLETLIDFAYSLRLQITKENVEGLLLGALHLKADEIINACCDFVSERLNAENAIKRLELAENLRCAALVETCRRFILENFEEVSLTEGFLQAPLSFIKDLICADDLRTCEEKIYEAVIRWIEKGPPKRNDHLPELLSCVRLTYISPKYLIDCVDHCENIRTSLPCRDLVDIAKNYHICPDRRHEISILDTRPRKRMRFDPENNNPLGNPANNNPRASGIHVVSKRVIYSIQHLNTEACTWQRPKTFDHFCHTFTVASSSDTIYFNDMEGLTSHDIPGSQWTYDRRVLNLRVCPGSAVLQNKLYICGGTDITSCLNSVSCYDLKTKRYETISRMNSGRILPGVVAFGQQLYVFGGLDSSEASQRTAEKYDPNCKTWTLLASMSSDRYGMGCTSHNGKIYVCGGKSISSKQVLVSAEVYDPVRNCWESISPMKTPRLNFSLVSDGRKLYAIGGCFGRQLLNSTEIYDPHSNMWEFGPDIEPTQKYVQAFAFGCPV